MRNTSAIPMKNGGYWHALAEAPRHLPKAPPPEPSINCYEILRECRDRTRNEWIKELSLRLGVGLNSLLEIGVAWAPGKLLAQFMPWHSRGSWAFPMRSGGGDIVGIRLRTNEGEKIAVKGSRDGLFIPQARPQRTAWIVEGPTDTAACLSIGVFGLGRPNCRGAIAHTQVSINRLRIERAVIVGEPDAPKWEGDASPGMEGAKRLATELQIPVATMVLPAKDMRKFVQLGGTRKFLEGMERNLIWKLPE
jgi:hypothetical protein